jgi:hypothetical protein
MILPTTDISIIDVRNVLNYPSTDLGTLCSCPNINKWAKYKPVRYSFTYNRPANWWKGEDGDCSLEVTSYGALFALIAAYRLGADGGNFVYKQPRGYSSNYLEPFRLGDFAGYDSNAMSPIVVDPLPDEWYSDAQKNMTASAGVINVHDGWLTLEDLGADSEAYDVAYFAVAIQRKDGTGTALMQTSTNHYINQVIVDTSKFALDVPYTIYYFYYNGTPQGTMGQAPTSGAFLPCPSSTFMQDITFKNGGYNILLNIDEDNTDNVANYTISMVNSTTSTVPVRNMKLYWLYRNTNPITDTLRGGEGYISLADQNIPINNIGITLTGAIDLTDKLQMQPLYGAKLTLVYSVLGVYYMIDKDLYISTVIPPGS